MVGRRQQAGHGESGHQVQAERDSEARSTAPSEERTAAVFLFARGRAIVRAAVKSRSGELCARRRSSRLGGFRDSLVGSAVVGGAAQNGRPLDSAGFG